MGFDGSDADVCCFEVVETFERLVEDYNVRRLMVRSVISDAVFQKNFLL